MPRKRKPAAKKQAPKKQAAPKSAKQKNPPHNGFGSVWGNHVWDVKKKKWVKGVGYASDGSVQKSNKAPSKAPQKAPQGSADGGGTPEPLKPVDALAEWRRQHPVTPPTYTGEWAGDLGGGPQQTAPGAPPKHNGDPIYGTPAPPVQTPTTDVAPERVSWGDLLASYMGDMRQSQLAGWVYSPGTVAPPPQPAATALPMRPDINPETAQMMMKKVSSGYVEGV